MRFEWDEKKSRNNFKKHSVSFDEAKYIWSDPNSYEFEDLYSEHEIRFIRIGLNVVRGILLVVFTERKNGETIRIISARKANQWERALYARRV